ncbi:MAG: hypothetical protein LBU07_03670 [Coriobacteriales bacterium]|jgi:type II restriction enzyme|nr:hypothetical protein [Coriobacteriales bacterium]
MLYSSATELVTSRQETRTGFVEFALEKNKRSKPFIESAKAFHHFALQATTPSELLTIPEIREPLLTASGLSDKALKYFTEEDRNVALQELIKNFLEPAGHEFVEEAVYRFLLIRGDSLGGSMRNAIGAFAQQKLIRFLLSVMSGMGMDYYWLASQEKTTWSIKPDDDFEIENGMKAIAWVNEQGNRTLAFNLTIPIVGKNIDLCLFDCDHSHYDSGSIVSHVTSALMLGELKGGIDPAGADEHWKTANTALDRIRNAYRSENPSLQTSFVGAAIENSMAEEIFLQLQTHKLSFAANLTKSEQIYEYCKWLLSL